MKIEYCYQKTNTEWDDFVNDNDGDIAQTSAWGNYDFHYNNWENTRFFVKSEGSIVAGCQINIVKDNILGNIGLVQYGPCFKSKTPELMHLIAKELKNSIQRLNLLYLIVATNHKEHDLIPYLENEKFESRFPNTPPYRITTLTDSTLYIDLTLSEDEILKQMNRNRKRGIIKGLKSPFKVSEGVRDNLKVFYDLYNDIVARRPFTDPITKVTVDWYPLIDTFEELCRIWDELDSRGWIKLYLGTVNEEIICGIIVFPFGNVFRSYHWGYNDKYAEYHISDTMHWELIKKAKELGFKYYDFVDIDPDVAQAFLSSEPISEEIKAKYFYGPTTYKLQFGGQIVNYPERYVFYSDKMKQWIETASDELEKMLKLSKDLFWAQKRFFRYRK